MAFVLCPLCSTSGIKNLKIEAYNARKYVGTSPLLYQWKKSDPVCEMFAFYTFGTLDNKNGSCRYYSD
jgi:hypothetical protein